MIQAAMILPYLILIEAELPEARIALRASYLLFPWSPAALHTWHFQRTCNSSSHITSTLSPHWADSSTPGEPQEQNLMDDTQAEAGIKPQLSSRGSD